MLTGPGGSLGTAMVEGTGMVVGPGVVLGTEMVEGTGVAVGEGLQGGCGACRLQLDRRSSSLVCGDLGRSRCCGPGDCCATLVPGSSVWRVFPGEE